MPSIEDLRKVEMDRLRKKAHDLKESKFPENVDAETDSYWCHYDDQIECCGSVERLNAIISELEDGKVGG